VTAVRYRPGQRHVLRYDPVPAGQPGGSVFAKLYRDGRSAPAFELAEAVADHLERGGGLRGARPLALLPDDDLLLYPQVGGGPLAGLLGASRTDVHGLLGRAGAALRSLQHDPALAGLRGLRAHDLDGELRAIARAAEHVDALLPATGRAIAELLERASELHARLPGEDAVFAHGDFKADHLWVAPEGLTLLDFDTCSLADPALDVGKFLADLDYWYARHDLPGLAAAQQAFLDGYCGGSPPPARRSERARLYEALVLTKITLRRVRLFDPDWAERTERLVDRTGGLLSALQAARTPAGHASPP
jgi:hypothetical protein